MNKLLPALCVSFMLLPAIAAAENWVRAGDLLYDADHAHVVAQSGHIEVSTCYVGTGCDTRADRKSYEPYYTRISCRQRVFWDWDYDQQRWNYEGTIPARTMVDDLAKYLCEREASLPRR